MQNSSKCFNKKMSKCGIVPNVDDTCQIVPNVDELFNIKTIKRVSEQHSLYFHFFFKEKHVNCLPWKFYPVFLNAKQCGILKFFVFLGETLDGADGVVSIDELRIVQNAALGTAHDTALGLTI